MDSAGLEMRDGRGSDGFQLGQVPPHHPLLLSLCPLSILWFVPRKARESPITESKERREPISFNTVNGSRSDVRKAVISKRGISAPWSGSDRRGSAGASPMLL